MKIKIHSGTARGTVIAPPSKSYAHRMLICSALANGKSLINGISDSEDILATLDCINAIGAKYFISGRQAEICGVNSLSADKKTFMCRESGSTLRFFIPIALLSGGVSEFCGTSRLLRRGLGVYEDICTERNIFFENGEKSIRFEGKLTPGVFNVRGDISSQFISGLMLALPLACGDSVINITTPLESLGYVLITADVLRMFGVETKIENDKIYIKGNQSYIPRSADVEGDMSNAAFAEAFNVLGGDVCVEGLNPNTLQADKVYRECFRMIKEGSPVLDVSSCPDLAPILMALAAACQGVTLTGTKRLKIKESDRAAAMACELKKFGTSVDIFENSVIVNAENFHKPREVLCGHNDHRIVMALFVISTLCGAEIDGGEAVKKSYPDFFRDMKKLGIEVESENEF